MIQVTVTSNTSGRVIKSSYTARQLLENFMDEVELAQDMTKCDCQPIGETNVVECNCDEEWDDFKLVLGE